VLGAVARKYAHKIRSGEDQSQRTAYVSQQVDQICSHREAGGGHGAAAVGATIYFGSDQSTRQIVEVAPRFCEAPQLGMATVLWCYLRNNAFKKDKIIMAPPI